MTFDLRFDFARQDELTLPARRHPRAALRRARSRRAADGGTPADRTPTDAGRLTP